MKTIYNFNRTKDYEHEYEITMVIRRTHKVDEEICEGLMDVLENQLNDEEELIRFTIEGEE